MVLWGHRFPTSTPSRIADCSGLPPMRGLKGLQISFGSSPFRRTQYVKDKLWTQGNSGAQDGEH